MILAYLMMWQTREQMVSMLVSWLKKILLITEPTTLFLSKKSTSSRLLYYFSSMSMI